MLKLQILYVLNIVVGIKHDNDGFDVNFIRDVITLISCCQIDIYPYNSLHVILENIFSIVKSTSSKHFS